MTYDARERSTHDGSPVELFEFTRGADSWRYTSQAVDYDLAGIVYTAVPIRRTSSEATQAIERSELRVTLPRDIEVASGFIQIPPSNLMLLTIRRVHRGDGEVAVVWLGRVLNAEWRAAEVELFAEPVFTSLRRAGLRRLYGRNCPHALYDSGCLANPADHRTTGPATAIDGVTVSVAAAAGVPANSLNGGYAAWTSESGTGEQRMIVSHSGADVELVAPPTGLVVGATVQLHAGCLHTLTDCDTRFANTGNYGGFPFIPLRNPFNGQPTF